MDNTFTFYFYDKESCEEFFVVSDTMHNAMSEAKKYFEKPVLCDVVTDEYAEMMGLDTY